MRTKAEMMEELGTMMRDVFAAGAAGAMRDRIARAHGYVDGYMRALLDLEFATRAELLALVARERERVAGPALRATDAAAEVDGVAAA